MNLTFNTSTKQIAAPCLRFAFSQMLKRGTCKIAVEVDAGVVSQLDGNEIKPRHHPGIVKPSYIQLPKHINEALNVVIGDYPVKKLIRDCKQLHQYITKRHPPPEKEDVEKKMRIIKQELEKKFPSDEQMELMTEAEQMKWEQKYEQILRKRIAERTYAWKPISYGPYEALTYAVGRGAGEYAALMRILHELVARDPEFQPRSFFDFGAGIGTGMWAASSLWKDSIYEYFNVDSSRDMNDLSELILREGRENQEMTLRNVYYRQFLPSIETKYNLVICSHSLFELPSANDRKETVMNLWRKCDGYLIVVEEGSRRGSELVNEARHLIIKQTDEAHKGHVFAPCPHESICPRLSNIMDTTPCNFETFYSPPKVGELALIDRFTARYSYVVFKKGEPQDPTLKWPRIVRPTLVRSKHAICRMCTADGKLQEIIFTKSKHGRNAYMCAKASRWGDRLPISIGEEYEIATKTSTWKRKIKERTADEDDVIPDFDITK